MKKFFVKDSNIPLPRSPFEIYSQTVKPDFQRRFSNANEAQISKMIDNAWKKASIEEKDHYFELSKKEIESHEDDYYF